MTRPVVLCILDGWGVAPTTSSENSKNAIQGANPKYYNFLLNHYPNSLLSTSGEAVGLPEGQMGNSEVGHMTIGSGRVIYQDLPRVSKAIADKSIENNKDILKLIETLKTTNKTCHIAGLASDGGVHAHIDHMLFLANFIKDAGVSVVLHIITDGRDTSPKSALKYVDMIKDLEIGTISGRYYAMDRDKRFERTEEYYNAITTGNNNKHLDAFASINNAYAQDINDEFIKPESLRDYKGMVDGDAFIMTNFRSDRARQIMLALADPNFTGFNRKKIIKFSHILTMTEYSEQISQFTTSIFHPQIITHTLPEILAENNLRQLRIAETEKYAHVTFFFNAGREIAFIDEDRIMIPSPDVATYDLKPEMSAFALTDQLTQNIISQKYDFILVNYANTDMVGHTGNYDATVKAVKVIDECIEIIHNAVKKVDGVMMITADHGNAEQMYDNHLKNIHTAHTTNPVPFILICEEYKALKLKNGSLADIAPTILTIMKLDIPKEMTGESLIEK